QAATQTRVASTAKRAGRRGREGMGLDARRLWAPERAAAPGRVARSRGRSDEEEWPAGSPGRKVGSPRSASRGMLMLQSRSIPQPLRGASMPARIVHRSDAERNAGLAPNRFNAKTPTRATGAPPRSSSFAGVLRASSASTPRKEEPAAGGIERWHQQVHESGGVGGSRAQPCQECHFMPITFRSETSIEAPPVRVMAAMTDLD